GGRDLNGARGSLPRVVLMGSQGLWEEEPKRLETNEIAQTEGASSGPAEEVHRPRSDHPVGGRRDVLRGLVQADAGRVGGSLQEVAGDVIVVPVPVVGPATAARHAHDGSSPPICGCSTAPRQGSDANGLRR